MNRSIFWGFLPISRTMKAFCPSLLFSSSPVAGWRKGQAVVEYVLILTVAVVVIGGLLLKLNEGFKNWGKSIVGGGGFVECLFQTGQLPPNVDCTIGDMKVEGLSASSDTPGSPGPDGETSGGDTSNRSSDSDGGASGGGDSNGADDSSAGGAGNLYAEQDSSSSSSGSGKGKRKGKGQSSAGQGGAGDSANGSVIAMPSSAEGMSGKDERDGGKGKGARRAGRGRKKKKLGFNEGLAAHGGQPGYAGRRHRAISSYGHMDEMEEKRKKRLPVTASAGGVTKKKDRLGGDKKTQRIIQKKPKAKAQDIKEDKWSFGNIFRVVLIICIIVVMALLIGSQTMSVKKSMK